MRLGFLSDLHLAPHRNNRCTSTPAELIGVIDMLERGCDRVICVGDTYDLLRPARPRGWRRELAHIRQQMPELKARLDRLEQVVGNHDRPLIALGVCEEWTLISPSQRVLVMHGHQWDVWLKRVWGLEESANFVAGWLERTGLDGISEWMGDVPGRVQAIGARGAAIEGSSDGEHAYWLGAQAELERGFDVMVSGHTHGLELREMPGGKLGINTGSHVHGHRDAAVLDVEEGWALTWRDGAVRQVASWSQGAGWEVAEHRDIRARWREVSR